jgi:ribosomal protein S18 acetylase RimI-like enzyme
VLSSLKWARLRGAREAWLQVEADNEPALGLYRSIGFSEIYRYHYRRPREA